MKLYYAQKSPYVRKTLVVANEAETLRYAITSNWPKGADVGHSKESVT